MSSSKLEGLTRFINMLDDIDEVLKAKKGKK